MPDAITAIFGANFTPMNQALSVNAQMVQAWKSNIQKQIQSTVVSSTAPAALAARGQAGFAKAGFASQLSEAAVSGGALRGVMRELLVIFREIGRGNWSRIPGSVTLVLQYMAQLRSSLGLLGAVFTVTGAVAAGAIGAIVASFYIFEKRVDSLSKKLTSLTPPDLVPRDIGRLTAIQEIWEKIGAAIAEAVDKANSANEAFGVAKDLLSEQQSQEKKILEIYKQRDLDKAGNNEVERRRILMEYAGKESEMAKRHFDERHKMEQDNIDALKAEAEQKRKAAEGVKYLEGGVIKSVPTKEAEKEQEEILKRNAENLGPVVGGVNQISRDRALITHAESQGVGWQDVNTDTTREKVAEYEAAKDRVAQHEAEMKRWHDFQLAKQSRETAMKERDRLVAEAAAASADAVTKEAALNKAKVLDAQILENENTIRALGGDETKKRGASHYGLNAAQRIGAYAATPPDMAKQTELLRVIAHNTNPHNNQPKSPGPKKPAYSGAHS